MNREPLFFLTGITRSLPSFASVAFLSIGVPSSPHSEITRAAAEATGFPSGGVGPLVEAVHAPDFAEGEWEPHLDNLVRYDATRRYRPSHHGDRVPPGDDATAFQETGAYIRERRDAARDAGTATEAVEALGQALHALQDCFSHSDFVDLPRGEQERFVAALLRDVPPPAVRLTAYLPGADDPGMPEDPYPHDRFAKDGPDQNEEAAREVAGTTKFEAAKEAAIHASVLLLDEVVNAWDAEMEAAVGTLSQQSRSPIPALFVAPAVLLLALWHRWRGRIGRRSTT